jgi:uncharacterized DUF497 family protein
LVVRFKWIEWNRLKIAAHGLTVKEVEVAFANRVGGHRECEDESFETFGRTPSGRLILIVWKFDEEFDALSEDFVIEVVFVVTAY